MFLEYLQKIGLANLTPVAKKLALNNFVEDVLRIQRDNFSQTEDKSLFTYRVPKLTSDGSCSFNNELGERPYNLATVLGDSSEVAFRLWQLKKIIYSIQKIISADWFGIYQKIKKRDGQEVLVKLAYQGAPSRAEFPLTQEFAKQSNNSTVGLAGKAIIVEDISKYSGPYYKCDGRVKSEFCCPILNSAGHVVGIIDAESFLPDFFNYEKQLQIAKISRDLGARFFLKIL